MLLPVSHRLLSGGWVDCQLVMGGGSSSQTYLGFYSIYRFGNVDLGGSLCPALFPESTIVLEGAV